MRPLTDRRLAALASCCLLLTALTATARSEDFFGYCEVVSGPKSSGDLDVPPRYIASRPRTPAPAPSAVPPIAGRQVVTQVVFASPSAEPQVTSQARQAIGYFGSAQALATLSQMPQRPAPSSGGPPTVANPGKPFQMITRDPTVSPYLNLHREESVDEGVPNYFAFVRPQLEQIETNRRQMREIQRLNQRVQAGSAAVGVPSQPAVQGSTGHVARFMDTAQYYGRWR